MQIVDTNIVLRYILADHPDLSARSKRIFDENIVTIPVEVLCEVVFVLLRVYKISRKEISRQLKIFFAVTRCELPHRDTVIKGLDVFAENNLGFVDCLLVGYRDCENTEIHTFDKGLQRVLDRLI